jgi:hypothetical protein
VGNKVCTLEAGTAVPIRGGYVPQINDVLLIKVERPLYYPKALVFENRFGGLITLEYPDGETKYIGQVLKPILGVGRFLGTQYAEIGRVRANHTGVIDISTSPMGEIGGFQIIPANHGMSNEMGNARMLTQWMVISPLSALKPSLENVAPFFRYYINPNYKPLDLDAPLFEQLYNRFIVDVKLEGKNEWEPMPTYSLTSYMDKALPNWAMGALKKVTHFRILFPVYLKTIL